VLNELELLRAMPATNNMFMHARMCAFESGEPNTKDLAGPSEFF